jgi:hypothetical protein
VEIVKMDNNTFGELPESDDQTQEPELSTLATMTTKKPERYPLVSLDKTSQNFGRVATCIDLDTTAGRIEFHNAIVAADEDSRDVIDQVQNIVSWVCLDSEWTDEESGEVKRGVRWTLVCDDGTTITGTSETVLSGLRLLCVCEGCGPWDPPKRVKICAKTTSKKRTAYLLVRVL